MKASLMENVTRWKRKRNPAHKLNAACLSRWKSHIEQNCGCKYSSVKISFFFVNICMAGYCLSDLVTAKSYQLSCATAWGLFLTCYQPILYIYFISVYLAFLFSSSSAVVIFSTCIGHESDNFSQIWLLFVDSNTLITAAQPFRLLFIIFFFWSLLPFSWK